MTSVTVVIPTHDDDPDHLRESVSSALGQRPTPPEVIVVDDGSTSPASLGALAQLPSGVSLLRQDNAGPAAARNAGITQAAGDVIVALDADDRLSPQFVREAVTVLAEPSVTAAYPRVERFGTGREVWPTKGDLGFAHFVKYNAVPVTSAFRRSDWATVGGFDATMRRGNEDHEWWLRLLSRRGGVVRPLPTAVLYYRLRSDARSAGLTFEEALSATRRHILDHGDADLLRSILEVTWTRMDRAEADAHRAWNDTLQLRKYLRPAKRLLARAGRRSAPEG